MSADEFIKTGEIPALFNKGPRWLERHIKELREEGFPKPISRGVYLRHQVIAFRDARGRSRHGEGTVTGAVTLASMPPPHTAKSVRQRIEQTLSHGRDRR